MRLESCYQDFKLASRTLRKSPVFALAAIATLALGIGANTAVFQLLDAVFLRTLPVPDPNQLALIQVRGGNRGFGISEGDNRLTWPLFAGIRNHQQGFSRVIAWADDTLKTGVAPDTRQLPAVLVSGEFFSTLEIPPAAGRLFNRSDDQPRCPSPGVVLSYAFWNSEYGGQSSAIGRRLVVRGHPLEIIGVAPPGFTGLEAGKKFDLALPLCAQVHEYSGDQHFTRADVFWLNVMGRLKPGWTLQGASQQMLSISPGLFAATAPTGYSAKSTETYKKLMLAVLPGKTGVSWLRVQYRSSLILLLGITSLVLLISCANLANLMLARASSRRREFAVRVALGASRFRLMRQVLTECVLLAAAGSAAGMALANILSRGILTFLQSSNDPLSLDLTPDWRMLAFTATIAVASCLLFGLVPALRSLRSDPGEAIKSGGRGLTADRKRFSFQRALIVVQVSISLVLVSGALLMVRSFHNLISQDPGFRTRGMLIASFDMSQMGMPAAQIKPAVRTIIEEVRAIPVVESAAGTTQVLIDGGSWTLGLTGALQGSSKFTWVTPGYFETVGTSLVSGRDFNAADTEHGPKVVIVNETFARTYFPGVNPLGRTFRSSQEPGYPEAEYQVIAVCKDTRYNDMRSIPPAQSFAPISQHPSYGPWAALFVRSTAPLGAVTAAIKQRIARSHPGVGMEFRVFENQIRDSTMRERLLAALSSFFGILAAVLAAIGLYGVMAYIVAWRRNEIGIRMALGATRFAITRLFMREAAILAAVGVCIGLAGALVFARAAKSLLFGFSAYDPFTYCAAAAVLEAVAVLGSYLPARRAARLDPVAALQYE